MYLDDLLAIRPPEPPDDFEAFWLALYERARSVDVAARVIGDGPARFDVEFTSLDGVRLGGWLVLPSGPPSDPQSDRPWRGLVVGHGYGGREGPDVVPVLPDAATLYFCARGLPARGLVPGIPDTAAWHVLNGISSKETYVHGRCAADQWCATTALLSLVPSIRRVDYVGGSFGGGIGALALPWDDRVTSACLYVPSFGHHPRRLAIPGTGSGEAVRVYAAAHPEVADVLAYFDAASAARFMKHRVQVAAALEDPAVPPVGQFAVYNALPDPKELIVLSSGHPTPEAEEQSLVTAQRAFLSGTDSLPG